MAMVHSAAKAVVRTKMDAVYGPIPSGLLPAEQTLLDTARNELCDTIAQFVEYIQANAVVPVSVASVSGITTGGSLSGSGTGTGTIL